MKYTKINSKHQRSILKQIPNAGNQRINRISSCENIFEENKRIYDEALKKKKGFHNRLEHVNPVNSCSKGQNVTTSRISDGGSHRLINLGGTNNNYSNRQGNNRNRIVVWFNPLFCKLTNINIGRYFLNLLDRHFNKDNPLSKIFNRNSIKISYSCTNNMYEILNNHNKRLLDESNRNC